MTRRGELLRIQERLDDAAAWMEDVVEVARENLDDGIEEKTEALHVLAKTYRDLGDTGAARKLVDEVLTYTPRNHRMYSSYVKLKQEL